jgi:hypothetical protein
MKMTMTDAVADLRAKPVVPLWPTVGVLLNLSRGTVYAAAARREIETIRVGRSIRAVSAPLRKQLGLDAA